MAVCLKRGHAWASENFPPKALGVLVFPFPSSESAPTGRALASGALRDDGPRRPDFLRLAKSLGGQDLAFRCSRLTPTAVTRSIAKDRISGFACPLFSPARNKVFSPRARSPVPDGCT